MNPDARRVVARTAELLRRNEAAMAKSTSLMTKADAALDASVATLVRAARVRGAFQRLLGKIS